MSRFARRLLVPLFACLALAVAAAADKPGAAAPDPGDGGKADDAVRGAILSAPKRPASIQEVRERLLGLGGKLRTHAIANGGHEHPQRADKNSTKFLCVDTYSGPRPGGADVEEGELYVGFFLDDSTGALDADGTSELISWDRTKHVYNFWNLDKDGWTYRGDSNDALADTANVNVGAGPPVFPAKLRVRCSACHTLGAPVMKELEAPHNDWATAARPHKTDAFKLAPATAALFKDVADADHLRDVVKKGIDRLLAAREKVEGSPTLKRQVRSLFATMEMNLVSDAKALAERRADKTKVEIPAAFFIDARLAPKAKPVAVDVALYEKALKKAGSSFAAGDGAELADADHAFLVPARSYVDDRVIDSLVRRGLLDDDLVTAVLAVDFTTPVFSRPRASLIRYVPEQAEDAADLRKQLIAALKKAPEDDKAAHDLLANLTDPRRSPDVLRREAADYLDACAKAGDDFDAVFDWLRVASQRRAEVEASETAQSPTGSKITERGFRVVFPEDKLTSRAGALRLDPTSGRAVPR